VLIRRNEHLDVPALFAIFATGLIEERAPCFWRSLQRTVEELLGAPP
jgi:hypothetical protein